MCMIKCQWYMIFLMPVLHFGSVSALFPMDCLKCNIIRMEKFAQHKYIVNY